MNTRELFASPATEHRWTALPYGVWVCADGREVLFNRYYKPIWQRIGGAVLAADADEWVSWKRQSWFYSDGDTRQHADLCRRLEEILKAFQAVEDITPMLQAGLHRASQSRAAQKRSAA